MTRCITSLGYNATMERKRQRHYLRYSLRSLLWLTVIVSSSLAWVAYHVHWIRERHAAKLHPSNDSYSLGLTVPDAPWILRLFGEKGRARVVCYDAADVAYYKRLFPEADVVDDRVFYGDFPIRGHSPSGRRSGK